MKNYNDVNIDWSYYRDNKHVTGGSKLIMTLPNTGCAFDCPFCGGSRYATNKIMGIKKTLVNKDNRRVIDELRSLGDVAKVTSIYALQCYSETKARLHQYLDAVREMGYKSVFFETYHLPAQDTLEKMGKATEAYIMLSPQSHDPAISKLSGRGTYTMPEMEEWIARALDAGIAGIMIWFFIGMPQQPPQSVYDSIAYSTTLLRKFRGKRVLPLICPMVPFLDPGSRFFEEPQKHGYRIFHKTLEQHRQAMVDPLWHRRLNYETEWMSRRQIQDVTYTSIERLVRAKAEYGILPTAVAHAVLKTIDETRFLLAQMEHALELDGKLPINLREAIRVYNRKILAYASDQIFPMQRPFGGRWYDDFTIPKSMIQELTVEPQLTPNG